MQTRLNIDDDLLKKAQESTGVRELSALVERALRVMLERDAARRLADMGGTAPDMQPIPRRRFRTPEEAVAAGRALRAQIGANLTVEEILAFRNEGRR